MIKYNVDIALCEPFDPNTSRRIKRLFFFFMILMKNLSSSAAILNSSYDTSLKDGSEKKYIKNIIEGLNICIYIFISHLLDYSTFSHTKRTWCSFNP